MECDHIVGLAYGIDESWLVYVSDRSDHIGYIEIDFVYCPLCGKILQDGEILND